MAERELPLFPLNVVLFPGMRLPLHIFEERYKLMIGACMVTDQTFGVALIQSGPEVGGPAEVHPVGTTARIIQVERLPEGRMNLVAVGADRFRILERFDDQPYAIGRVELLTDDAEGVPETLIDRVQRQLRRYISSQVLAGEQADALDLPSAPNELSYLVAAVLKMSHREGQRLLEYDSAESRLRRELAMMRWAIGSSAKDNVRSFSLN